MTSLATHHVMQANKGKNTGPELVVRQALRASGLSGYRLQWKKVPGRPDICYPGRKVAIFVNGCFWHRCPHCDLPLPKSNTDFWSEKFARNRARDERNERALVLDGWTVIVVWECRLKGSHLESTMHEVIDVVERASHEGCGPGRIIEAGSPRPWQRRRAFLSYRMRHTR